MINRKPCISIIIPIYNIYEYLEECLERVVNQSYTNLDILLIDDGSTDGCGNICDNYAAKDDRIRVFHVKNGGLSKARNIGLSKAIGDYIAFVDGDDYVSLKMYERLIDVALENNCDVVECKYYHNNQVPKDMKSVAKVEHGKEVLERQIDSRYLFPNVAVWNKIYRAEIVKDLSFPEGKIHEDYLFQCCVLLRTQTYGFIDEELYCYRIREGSITHQKFNLREFDKLSIYKERTAYLILQGELSLADLAREEEFIILFSLFWKTSINGMKEANSLKKELYERRQEFIKSNISLKRKLVYVLFYINPHLYLFVRNIIG